MVATQNAQSLADFQQTGTETLDRLNRTGQAEVLTVDGEVRAVILSPAAYDALTTEHDVSDEDIAMIQLSVKQLRAGQGRDAFEFLDELRAKLLAGDYGPVEGTGE